MYLRPMYEYLEVESESAGAREIQFYLYRFCCMIDIEKVISYGPNQYDGLILLC